MTRPPITASSDAVRIFMQRLPRGHTTPEISLRVALHSRGIRFRLHRRDLPGRPDIVLVRLRLAVFVDGCFWHGCRRHAVAPRSNATFWARKIQENRRRDRRKDAELATLGWRALHVWEHDDPELVATHLAEAWRSRRMHLSRLLKTLEKARGERVRRRQPPSW